MMLLHSIAAHNAVFPAELSENSCIFRDGRWFEGSWQQGQLCVSRIISTNPADYLRYSPGQLLSVPREEHKNANHRE